MTSSRFVRGRALVQLALTTALALAAPAFAETPAAGPRMPDEHPEMKYLNPADFAPNKMLPLPAARGSDAEALELATVRAQIAAASPERLKQAAWDGEHEDPSLFNETLGRDLTKLPATWDLLVTVQEEAEAATGAAKHAFDRVRPYGVDPSIKTCVPTNPNKAATSYPSGHATAGYSVGWTLARLLPEWAPYIHERARDYAYSRVVCGVHFPSDTEASHMLATLVTDKLLADPRLAGKIAAARAELAAAPK